MNFRSQLAWRGIVASSPRLLCVLLLSVGCHAEDPVHVDLRPMEGKSDIASFDVPLALPAGTEAEPGQAKIRVRSSTGLTLTISMPAASPQPEAGESPALSAAETRFQIHVSRGEVVWQSLALASPKLIVDDEGTNAVEYDIVIANLAPLAKSVQLKISGATKVQPKMDVIFNQPDCDDGCTDKSGGLRQAILDSLSWTQKSVEVAVYGVGDPAIVQSLCDLAKGGAEVRVLADDKSLESENVRGYYDALYGEAGLTSCGAQVEAIQSNGLMHHKFIVIDRDSPRSRLIVGSTNLTEFGLEKNHNHMFFIDKQPELVAAYLAEFQQLFDHCRGDHLNNDGEPCNECSKTCTRNLSSEGPFFSEDTSSVSVYFAPSDDPLGVLRGPAKDLKRTEVPEECKTSQTCICRTSGSQYLCSYCGGTSPKEPTLAPDQQTWGLIGRAKRRALVTIYAGTDQCFALALSNAQNRGVTTAAIWDKVNSTNVYNRDDYLCAQDVPVFVSNWSNNSPLVRNHNKTMVIDDLVFDGSLNFSSAGQTINNESVLVIDNAVIADRFATYIDEEIALLGRLGVTALAAPACACGDLIDNDGDGLFDGDDPDCDGAQPSPQPEPDPQPDPQPDPGESDE